MATEYIFTRLKNVLNKKLKILFNEIPLEILGIISFDNLARYADLYRHYSINLQKYTSNTI